MTSSTKYKISHFLSTTTILAQPSTSPVAAKITSIGSVSARDLGKAMPYLVPTTTLFFRGFVRLLCGRVHFFWKRSP